MNPTKLEIESDNKILSKFIKVKKAADILGVTRNTVYARMKAGILSTATMGDDNEVLFYRNQVEALARGEV